MKSSCTLEAQASPGEVRAIKANQAKSRAPQALLPGHEEKMKRIREAVVVNQRFLRAVLEQQYVFQNGDVDYQAIGERLWRVQEDKMSKVRKNAAVQPSRRARPTAGAGATWKGW